jgi:tripartite-type tricarboxylate transporter receptor subunit TctC
MTIRKLAAAALAFAALAFGPGGAAAQDYPSRGLSLVVSTGPGSGQDLLARKLAEQLKERLGQPVVVDNKPGANALIAMNHVAQARPDGHTLYLYTSIYIAGPLVQKNFNVDQIDDLTHIIRLVGTPGYYMANAKAPFRTMEEMFAWAKANPGKLSMGFPAINTQMDATLMFDAVGVEFTPVLYQGTGSAMMSNLLSGEIMMAQTAYSVVRQHVQEGTLRPLAVLAPKRFPQTPDVPAMGEVLPQVKMIPNAIGISGPKGLPSAIVTRLNGELNRIIEQPEIREWIVKTFWSEIGGGTPEEWRQAQVEERERYQAAAKKMGLKPQ